MTMGCPLPTAHSPRKIPRNGRLLSTDWRKTLHRPLETLEKIRQSIEGFLEAVFSDWTSESTNDLLQPKLEFLVEVEVVAGRICRES